MHKLKFEAESREIIASAISVHRELGPGLFEEVYRDCLAHELLEAGFRVEKEVIIPLCYKGLTFGKSYRLDLLVNSCVVIELKVVDQLSELHKRQLYTYIKLSKKPLGLLFNFNSAILKDGIIRLVN